MDLWESILLAALGGVIAILAGVVGSRLQERTASRVRAELHAREDRFRLHKERVDAYAHFHVMASDALRALKFYSREPANADLRERLWEKRNLVFYACIPIELFGHDSVNTTAWALIHYIDASSADPATFDQEVWTRLINDYRRTVRTAVIGEERLQSESDSAPPASRLTN
ncbi:hypothetical protein AB0B66_18830 [Catellatospora sp. NPDC049111]|uniref:hypothetical protein n=1 Tax=Catellatospora sp. NPDC049111 TaxID=3155271 RepID=UPI0033E1BC65